MSGHERISDGDVRGTTRVAAIIGDPVHHSRSPAMYNAAFAATGLDWVFVAFTVVDGGAAGALDAMRTLQLGGYSVTMPLKTSVAAAVDELSDDARALASVNHVARLDDGRLFGDSTDGEGFVRSLRDAEVEPAGRSVLLLGAGGAARAVVLALARAGAAVDVAARRAGAAAAAAAVAPGVGTIDWALRHAALRDHDLLVNATPIGMGTDEVPIVAGALRPELVVADLVYHPVATSLLRAAGEAGCTTVDGIGMLVHQAALQFERWTGVPAPVAVMRRAALTG